MQDLKNPMLQKGRGICYEERVKAMMRIGVTEFDEGEGDEENWGNGG